MYKKLIIWIFVIVFAVSTVGCGSSADNSETAANVNNKVSAGFNKSVGNEAGYIAEDGTTSEGSSAYSETSESVSADKSKTDSTQSRNIANNANVGQKIIFTGEVNIETINFEKSKTDLCEYITSIGGIIQNSSFQGVGIGNQGMKSAQYLFRIPKVKYNQSFVDMKKFGTVVSEHSNGEDVSDQYFDTEARLKSLKIQQERLQALLQKAEKMEDILKIEEKLQTTLYDIENYTGTLKKWDSLIEYSSLTVNIREVEEIKPETPKEKDGLSERIAFGFKNSISGVWEFLQNVIVFLAQALPVLIPLALIGYIIYRMIRKRNKIKKNSISSTENNDNSNSKD
jgi:hypothetical protein